MQIKTTRYHFKSTRSAVIQKTDGNKCWQRCRESDGGGPSKTHMLMFMAALFIQTKKKNPHNTHQLMKITIPYTGIVFSSKSKCYTDTCYN